LIEAVYENGVWKPLVEVGFKEHQEYAGQYVALDEDRLVSHGTDGREVYRQAQAVEVKHPFIAHIEPADALPQPRR
jgi:predicted DNA-binding antitoxin AbrB/MazE fold protein